MIKHDCKMYFDVWIVGVGEVAFMHFKYMFETMGFDTLTYC